MRLPSLVPAPPFRVELRSDDVSALFAELVLADEVNRATPKAQSALLESMEEYQVSVDGNLLAIDLGLIEGAEAEALYRRTKAHELWTRGEIPGVVTIPDYPKSDIAWTTRVVGLRHYHDRLAWSWLAGLALRCARKFKDTPEAERIAAFLEGVAERDGMISEVYEPSRGWPLFKRWAYRSEGPFAWGAGMIAYGLEEVDG